MGKCERVDWGGGWHSADLPSWPTTSRKIVKAIRDQAKASRYARNDLTSVVYLNKREEMDSGSFRI